MLCLDLERLWQSNDLFRLALLIFAQSKILFRNLKVSFKEFCLFALTGGSLYLSPDALGGFEDVSSA
jgi:hypothetical protein